MLLKETVPPTLRLQVLLPDGDFAPQEGIARAFLLLPGDMPGYVNGREFMPPRPA